MTENIKVNNKLENAVKKFGDRLEQMQTRYCDNMAKFLGTEPKKIKPLCERFDEGIKHAPKRWLEGMEGLIQK